MADKWDRRPRSPTHGTREQPPGAIVHFQKPNLAVLCRGFSFGLRLQTKVPEKVTCPNCLRLMQG